MTKYLKPDFLSESHVSTQKVLHILHSSEQFQPNPMFVCDEKLLPTTIQDKQLSGIGLCHTVPSTIKQSINTTASTQCVLHYFYTHLRLSCNIPCHPLSANSTPCHFRLSCFPNCRFPGLPSKFPLAYHSISPWITIQ